MELQEFIEEFVERNSQIRLEYKVSGGYKSARYIDSIDDNLCMEWEILRGCNPFRKYAHHKVVGLTSILYSGGQGLECISIVIEKDDGLLEKYSKIYNEVEEDSCPKHESC
jgi:hypothetical protein